MKRIIIIIILAVLCMNGLFAQSKGALFLRSLILPGWGQVASGNSYGYAMMVSEVAAISTMFYLKNEHELKEQEAYEYAMKFAGILPGSYSDEYFAHLSRYQSSGFDAGGYNAMIREEAMLYYPDQLDLQQQYIDANIYSEEMAWTWSSSTNRTTYGNLRGDMNKLEDYAKIGTGVIILNHLVSAIDILRLNAEKRRTNLRVGINQSSPMLFLNYNF